MFRRQASYLSKSFSMLPNLVRSAMFLLTARFAPRRKENLKMATGSGNTSVVIGCSLKTKQAIHLKKELSPTLRIESVTYSGSCLSMFLIDFYEVVPLITVERQMVFEPTSQRRRSYKLTRVRSSVRPFVRSSVHSFSRDWLNEIL